MQVVNKFKLQTNFKPMYDQKRAIKSLVSGVRNSQKYQTLLGVTGSGKTFTAANVIQELNMPTLIISHNKTLAAQLYQEFRDFFPDNAVSYFVSYYDYYQPEAYVPSTDTYIEKDAGINEQIDKLRLEATTNLLTRKDVIVVASVSCIYNLGSPKDYQNFVFDVAVGMRLKREQIISRLIDLQYERSDFGFHRGTFRVTGDVISIFPAYKDIAIDIEIDEERITKITQSDPVTGELIAVVEGRFTLFPAKHFIADPRKDLNIFDEIRNDLEERVKYFKSKNMDLEAHRIKQKVSYDIEMIQEVGYVKGIENYSRYFDGRKPGDAPYALIEYFNEAYGDDWLVLVDESHITFPQIRGMYAGDHARKKTLIDYGFRLPSAFDNRPLQFDEFMRKIPRFIAVSATPADWELSMSGDKNVVEQLIRPTGIPDPEVEIRPTKTQVADVMEEITKRAARGERTLVTTLTKRTAEDLAEFLQEKGLKAHYLHSEVKTLERSDILDDLRNGKYDCLIGINLLREGLDLPEVSLVAILDADKEGFLRSEVSLIQTMGRAARHIKGEVILYADRTTGSMQRALDEVNRRREYQLEFNKKHKITPSKISKPIRERLAEREEEDSTNWIYETKEPTLMKLPDLNPETLTPSDRSKLIKTLKKEMRLAANDLNFELAISIRDKINELGG